jgi:hypothetical protein
VGTGNIPPVTITPDDAHAGVKVETLSAEAGRFELRVWYSTGRSWRLFQHGFDVQQLRILHDALDAVL